MHITTRPGAPVPRRSKLQRLVLAAFRRAQPFLNPPKGLVKDGQFSFEFGFFFEISSGRHGFRWKRL